MVKKLIGSFGVLLLIVVVLALLWYLGVPSGVLTGILHWVLVVLVAGVALSGCVAIIVYGFEEN